MGFSLPTCGFYMLERPRFLSAEVVFHSCEKVKLGRCVQARVLLPQGVLLLSPMTDGPPGQSYYTHVFSSS